MLPTYLQGLNQEQLEAATILDGRICVLAGAGTGKTHMLMARVAHMVESGINPTQILLVTFTKKAAGELNNRVKSQVGEKANGVLATTFHGLCRNILNRFGHYVGYDCIQIIGKDDDKTLLNHIMQAYLENKNLNKKDFPSVYVLLSIASQARNQYCDYTDVIVQMSSMSGKNAELITVYQFDILQILQDWTAQKRSKNYMSYDDMLYYTVRLFEENPTVRAFYDKTYQYVMCDEYQDTNRVQELLLRCLTTDYSNLCVVGDDCQSIYKFRGAVVENILNFCNRYPDTHFVKLEQNYRSTQEILDVSNAMLKGQLRGIPKVLRGQTHGRKPLLLDFQDENGAAKYIVDEIELAHENMIPYQFQAVLTRNAEQMAYVEKEMKLRNIPYEKHGGRSFLDDRNVLDMLAFLRTFVYPNDELAWIRILPLYEGIGPKIASDIVANMDTNKIEVSCFCKSVKGQVALRHLDEMRRKWFQGCTLREKIYMARDERARLYEREIQLASNSNKIKEVDDRRKTLSNYADILAQMSLEYRTLDAFLTDLVLNNPLPDDVQVKDKVVLSTIHSAKGLEWENVWLLQPVNDLIGMPNGVALDSYALQEAAEQQRLLYVALTRAKKRMELVVSREMCIYGKVLFPELSRFLQVALEKQSDCLDVRRL